MKMNLAVWLVCCGLLSLNIGCNHGVVRGQNPGPMGYHGGHGGGIPGDTAGQWQMNGPPPAGMPGQNMAAGPMYYDGPAFGSNDCPTCPSCPQGAIDVWRPTHHHTWEYNPPKNLKYPAPNQMPGVVQYPYYTCKGPSDFFYQGP